MKLSAIIVSSLLSLSVIGSPIASSATTKSSIDAGNSTSLPDDSIIDEAGDRGRFCFGANNKYNQCHGSIKNCVWRISNGGGKNVVDFANKFCKFYCSEIKSATQCKQSKYKANYHPKWACDEQSYC
ncbi:putative secreted protein [Wickerhamomyces ciferrii]|uniref:Secreted protein n=1 Tax=Wickerhamomyces ciferrii (strain ATCC 14091 / BCRC 22168 / CBS 111 / JCM 3599 / NBRC 0793 / NRRL Y-1031 F-60-10) TaxID=1206466 RepID=K0KMM6_WICCF|nr:uncharacterized protein BN7_6128 [Wickerhamomyces ciferrii]CCH46535.1 putative secreted protein [Wickerhamomyces ciferrii]